MRDIYNRQKTMENLLVRVAEAKDLSEHNKKLMLRFHEQSVAEGLSVARLNKYLYSLWTLSAMLGKDFDKANKDDMIALVGMIERTSKWADWTKQNYKVIIKRFFRWLREKDEYPKEVSWIKTTMRNNNHKLPEELLTQQEVFSLVKSADNARDKALILVFYESGCRLAEIANLTVKDIQFDDYGATIMVSGKTGQRRVRLVKGCGAVEALRIWLDVNPQKDGKESYVWLSLSTNNLFEPMGSGGFHKTINEIAKKAKITKKVNPHSFRHSRATHLANVLTEAQMKEMFGWTQGSKMASVYVHLSGRDVDKALVDRFGSITQKKDMDKIEENMLMALRQNPQLLKALVSAMRNLK